MIFSIFIILLVGVIAFFHYVQGFFSATISAMLTVLSAALAISYHENVVNLLLKGKMADYAHGMVLCMIFIISYVVLRVIFDNSIPGNVRTPSIVDKVGAGIMGLIAGIFTTGILATAIQMLPFDPGISFLNYSRQQVQGERKLIAPRAGGLSSLDTHIGGELKDPELDADKYTTKLLLPVDDWMMDTIYRMSDGGSLAGERPLSSVHPDYLQELFGERLGIELSGRRVALSINGSDPIDVTGVYTAASFPAVDGVVKELRPAGYQPAYKDTVKPGPGQEILVVRVKVNSSATDDEDGLFRFSTGSVRLVGALRDGTYKDYYPIGMLQGGKVLLDKPDDFLFVKGDDEFDAVFVVDQSLLVGGKSSNMLAAGVLLDVKRFGFHDLSGVGVAEKIPGDSKVDVLRSAVLIERLKLPPPEQTASSPPIESSPAAAGSPAATGNPAAAAAGTPGAPATPQPTAGKEISDDLAAQASTAFLVPGSVQIGANVADQDAKDAPVAGGKISLKGGQIAVAAVDPTSSLTQLSQGSVSYQQFFTPQGRTMVQVQMHLYNNTWEWMSQYSNIAVVDSNGNKYSPSGAYALVKGGDSRALFLRYDAARAVSVSSPNDPPDGNIYFIFLIPPDTELKSFTLGGKTQDLSSPLKVQ